MQNLSFKNNVFLDSKYTLLYPLLQHTLQQHRVVVRAHKAQILCLTGADLNVGRHDKAVDCIILKALFVRAGVSLIERTAGRDIAVHNKLPSLAEHACFKYAGRPFPFLERIGVCLYAVKCLVEIPAGNNVIALFGFSFHDLEKRPRLRERRRHLLKFASLTGHLKGQGS